MNRRISGIASMALVALLVGCSGGGGGGSTPSPTPTPTPAPPPVDTTPNTFTFPDQSSATRSAAATSGDITVSGINQAAAVSITGGEYSIDGGAFTSAAGTINNNQTIRVRVNTSGQFSTTVSATLTIGGVAATFSVTTADPDTTPDAYQFAAQVNVPRTTLVVSPTVTIAGIDSAAPVTITGGEYSIDGGAFTAAAGTISNGQTICVRLTSSPDFSTALSAVLKVGGVQAIFGATTLAKDDTPDPFQFARKSNGALGAWMTSDAATISGINTNVPVTITGGEYSIDGGAFTSAAGSIGNGQSLVVRTHASAAYGRLTHAHVTVSAAGADFEVASSLPNYTPDAVAFDGQDTIYLLSDVNKLVFKWSVSEGRYLDSFSVGLNSTAPDLMAWSPDQHRLYFGYGTGAIQSMDVTAATPAEVPFASTPMAVRGLVAVGKFVMAQDGSGAWATHYVYDSAGTLTDSKDWNYYSREYAWDPVTSRVYFFRDDTSPDDMHYEVIDQTTGKITGNGETPYHGAYSIQTPIRVAVDGQHILLGSGDIYKQSDLTWAGSLGSQVADARWFANGMIVALTTSNNQTTLRRMGANNLTTLEQLTWTGQALRIVGTDSKMTVLLLANNTVQFQTYVPNDDSDGDGVTNTQDAFPLDAAASVDSDHDGYPDAWNAGKTQADSTTGLALDAFPNDSACWLAAHGSGGVCNYGATMPNYAPDQVIDDGSVIYLLSSANKRVYRWSMAAGKYLNPYIVGIDQGYSSIAPVNIAYSADHQRLYLGYGTGAIRYIDVTAATPLETPFANTAMGVGGLAAVGKFVLAQDGSGAWATHYIFKSDGSLATQRDWNYRSGEYAWDPGSSRVYFFRDDTSPNDLQYEVVDQTTGAITSAGETPYHGDYSIQRPIRVSPTGKYVLIGSGDIYLSPALTWTGSVGSAIADARWFADGSLATLVTSGNQTQLRHLASSNLAPLEQRSYTGQALRVIGSDTRMTVVLLAGGTVQFQVYVPNDDGDGDGVPNTQDAFPLDAAASVDSDHDGYPDAWNAGKSQADSTTGLTLDAFPQDAACHDASQGSGGACDYDAVTPAYVPDQVAQDGDVVYLLSVANSKVYRWSISTGHYLKPYAVGVDQGFSTVAPIKMALSSAQHRLYVGYAAGTIRYIDVTAVGGTEVPFTVRPGGVSVLLSTGNYLMAFDAGYYNYHSIYNAGGTITANSPTYFGYGDPTWDPVTSRAYFGGSTNLFYEVIDQSSGLISTTGQAPYAPNFNSYVTQPIRVSVNGQYVVVSSGDLFDKNNSLAWAGTLGTQLSDARWMADGSLVTLTTLGNQVTLRRLAGSDLRLLDQRTYAGQAPRVVGSDTTMVVVVNNGGATQFNLYVPSNDTDGDGVANAQDAFPLDAAASVDTDHDGYPDSWNAGKSQSDSTTGLSLDAYPQDAECWLLAHGSGGVCDYGATMPNYTPDQVAQQGNVVYLLSSANKRVYRWSLATSKYLKPYIVGNITGFSSIAPTKIAVSGAQQRLYLGYAAGAIRYIDLTAGTPAENAFANLYPGVGYLLATGNYLLAMDTNGYGAHAIYNASGAITGASPQYVGYGIEPFWDPVNSRVYFANNYYLQYEAIDQANGQIGATGTGTYNGNSYASSPIRISVNGQYVLTGGGSIYDNANALSWAGSLPAAVNDARWMADGTLVTVTTNVNQTVLRRLGGDNFRVLEQHVYAGSPLRIVGSDSSMAILTNNSGITQFNVYVPSNDGDGDGVTNLQDAFPLDVAASVDTDGDGYPDSWNAGKGQADSTTGLTLDAFPQDAECWLSAHGSGGLCNYAATMPNYTPDQVAQQGGVIYLLSNDNKRVYRWSSTSQKYLKPYTLGYNNGFNTVAPTAMTYSDAQQRLYVGYASGVIRYFDVTAPTPVQTAFATAPAASGVSTVTRLAIAGNYLYSFGAGGALFDSSGTLMDTGGGQQSRDYGWDAATSRLYYFRDGTSPNDLQYIEVNQSTGKFGAGDETPYHGAYNILPPIRVSPSGQVLLGSGDLYNRTGLTWAGSIGGQVADARWFANGQLVTLITANNQTTLRRHASSNYSVIEQRSIAGQALRVVGTDAAMTVLTLNNGTVQFQNYVPSDDSDGDGVPNSQDAFPLDAAASVDTDHDGYPDAWNAGKTQADSTTGLVLDAFPNQAGCWLSSHGSGGICNPSATVPNYIPDKIETQGDVVYLLSGANKRVYRWSIATGQYLDPYVVGINQGFNTLVPIRMAYSGAHQRLYVGYENGAIRYFDVTASNPVETPFATLATSVGGIAAAGNYLVAQDYSGAWATHYVINSAGAITHAVDWNYTSSDYAYDPGTSRLYSFSTWSPMDLRYETIDQTTGQITGSSETPYHGVYSIGGPIRLSTDGGLVLLGSGDIYEKVGLTWVGTVGKTVTDARWIDNILVDVDASDMVEIRDAKSRAVLNTYQYLGSPLRVVFGTNEAYLVHAVSGGTAFIRLPFYDQDGDGIPRWWEQHYGLSDSNAADATGDLDGDGVNNRAEYQNHSDPTVADTDGDGLTDQQEIVTWHTDPTLADTDGDGLNDYYEVTTFFTNPRVVDTDGDGYSDYIEAQFGGDPNDVSSLPQPMYNYSQTFENPVNLSGWTTPAQSVSQWALDTSTPHGGSVSYKAGTIGNSQTSIARYRGFFRPGQLTYYARVNGSCCDYLTLYLDGQQVSGTYTTNSWVQLSVQIPVGVHDLEWRYQGDSYVNAADAAWIDDVVFTGQ